MALEVWGGKRIAIYCRVSTDEQAKEGVSLEEQKTRLRAYCLAMGWSAEIVEFIDDGYSAKSLDRPALQKLLKQVDEGVISRLMVTKLDRLSRRLLDLLNLIELLKQHEVSFVSTSESFDTDTPSGRLTLQVLGAVSEFERERIRERVIDNMLYAARSGKWLTQYPYGYRLDNKELVVHEQEAEVVRRIYQMFVSDGLGYYSIAKQLNAERIPSRFNKEWSIRSVKLLLTNPVYNGTLLWNRIDSSKKKRKLKDPDDWVELSHALPAIIDKELWDRAQLKVTNSIRTAPRAKSSPHLLSGFLKCGKCGAAMSIGWSGYPKRHRVYRCSAYKNKGTCQNTPYRADLVEEWFLEGLQRLINPVDGLAHQVDIEWAQKGATTRSEDKVKSARTRYQRQIEAYTAGLIDINVLAKEKEALEQAIHEAEKSSGVEGVEINYVQIENALREQIKDITCAIWELPIDVAKAKIRTLVDKVILNDHEDLEIVFV